MYTLFTAEPHVSILWLLSLSVQFFPLWVVLLTYLLGLKKKYIYYWLKLKLCQLSKYPLRKFVCTRYSSSFVFLKKSSLEYFDVLQYEFVALYILCATVILRSFFINMLETFHFSPPMTDSVFVFYWWLGYRILDCK